MLYTYRTKLAALGAQSWTVDPGRGLGLERVGFWEDYLYAGI